MHLFRHRSLALALGTIIAALDVAAKSSVETVLSHGRKVPGGTVMLFHDEKCRVAFQGDGNLSVNKRFGLPPYNPIGPFPTMWDTGVVGDGNYEYAMMRGGNFRIIRKDNGTEEKVVFSTHSNSGGSGPFYLGIDEECILGIYDSGSDKIWTNIRNEALKPGDRLNRGEMYRDTRLNAFLILQPSDGNLIVYDGQDFTDSSRTPLWSSNTAGDASDDYHLDIRRDGTLKLFEKPKRVYYSRDLQANGAECFNVILDACTYEPIAVPRPCPHEVELVMRDGEVIPSETPRAFHDGKCRVQLNSREYLNTVFVQHNCPERNWNHI